MKKFSIWLIYDLGFRADYKSLFTWLANKDAQECGNNTAFFEYDVSSNTNMVLLKTLKDDLLKNVSLGNTDRIYVIFKERNGVGSGGVFLHGGRRQAPWSGYGQQQTTELIPEG